MKPFAFNFVRDKVVPQSAINKSLLNGLSIIFKAAKQHNLVVGSNARILYADSNVRFEIAKAFNVNPSLLRFWEKEFVFSANQGDEISAYWSRSSISSVWRSHIGSWLIRIRM